MSIVAISPQETSADSASTLSTDIHSLEDFANLPPVSWLHPSEVFQRRQSQRISFQGQILMTPVEPSTWNSRETWTRATARNLSQNGISYEHQQPQAEQLIVVTFRLGADELESISMLTRLLWCRYARGGFYQSGGKFLKRVHLPAVEQRNDWDSFCNDLPPG